MRQLVVSFLTLMSFYRRHPMQALFLLVGLVTGVGLWAAVQLINDHARASYAEADELLGAEAQYWVRAEDGGAVRPEDYIQLRKLGFNQIFPVIETRRQASSGEIVQIIATDLLALGASNTEQASNPFAAESWLPFVQAPYQSWYPTRLAYQLGIEEGDQLDLTNGQTLPPARIQTQQQQGERVFMDVGAAMAVLDLTGFSYLGVGDLGTDLASFEAALPAGLVLVENTQALDLTQLTLSLHTNLTALGLLSFVVGIFIVFNAVRFSLVNRRTTLSTLRELGVGLETITLAIVLESLVWSLLGSSIGVYLGIYLGELMLPAVAVSLQSLYGANLAGQLSSSVEVLPYAMLLTLAGMFLALTLPLWQAAQETISNERRKTFESEWLQRSIKIGAMVGCVLLVMAFIGHDQVASVEAGFVVIGLVMLGGALLLPQIILLGVVLVSRLAPQEWLLWRWSVRDALLQLPHLRIALMALLLTLVANIGVTLLVGSFRAALTDWLDQRLSANVYITNSEALISNIDQQDWFVMSHERFTKDVRFRDRPANIFAVSPEAPDFADELIDADARAFDRWAALEAADVPAVIANEQVRYLGDTHVGDVINIQGKQFEVVGFIHDYGNPEFAFWLPKTIALEEFSGFRKLGVGVWIKPGSLESAQAYFEDSGMKPGDWFEQESIRAISLTIFDRTFAITQALNSLTLLVAAIALLAALLAVHQSRTVDYGHWRAIGVRWNEWFLILGIPLLLMIACTIVAAIPLGYILSWLLIHQLNVIAFGWTMDLLWDWQPIINLSLITFALVALTLIISLLRTRVTLSASVRQLGGGV